MKKHLYNPAFSINTGGNIKVIGETSAGKSSALEHLVSEIFHDIIKKRIGSFRSTITKTAIQLDSACGFKEIQFVGILKNEFIDKNKFQVIIIKAISNLIYTNKKNNSITKEELSEFIQHSFTREKNTDSVIQLLNTQQKKVIFENISNFFDSIGLLRKFNTLYNDVISKMDKYELDSVKKNVIRDNVRNIIGELFVYNPEAQASFNKIYSFINDCLNELVLELFEKKFNYNQVSLTLEFDEFGNPKSEEDQKFYDIFFTNNNKDGEDFSISIEILFESIHLKLPMSDKLIQIIDSHPQKDLLKFGKSYIINYFDNRGLFHENQDPEQVLDELFEQMQVDNTDICLNFINLYKNLLLDDTKQVYKEFMSENRMTRHNIFVFTHVDSYLHQLDDLEQINIQSVIRDNTSKIVNEIYSKSKVKNFSIIEFSNKIKKLKRFEDELDISTYTPSAFISHLIDELINSLSYRKKVPTFEIANKNIEIQLEITDSKKENFQKAINDFINLPEFQKNAENILVGLEPKFGTQRNLKLLERSLIAASRRLPKCNSFQSSVVSDRYSAYQNIDTAFIESLPKVITDDFLDYSINYLFQYVFKASDNLEIEIIENIKKSTKRNISKYSILGNTLYELYQLSLVQWTAGTKYNQFISYVDSLLLNTTDVYTKHLELLAKYILLDFNSSIERAIWLHLK